MKRHLSIIVCFMAIFVTSCKPSSETINKAIEQTQSAQATPTVDNHQEEINKGIALELVKDKAFDELTSNYDLCRQSQTALGIVLTEAQENCKSVEIWSVEKDGEGEYIVTLKYDSSNSGSWFIQTVKYIYGDTLDNGAIFRVLLDNNAVLPENTFAEDLVR